MKTRKEFPIPSSKRWRPACRCWRRGTAAFPEAVEEGRCGALVDERDYQALAAEMKKITRTPHSFAEMGLLASESVVANFEQSSHIAQLEGHYREANGDRAGGRSAGAGQGAGRGAAISAGTCPGQVGAGSRFFAANFPRRKKLGKVACQHWQHALLYARRERPDGARLFLVGAWRAKPTPVEPLSEPTHGPSLFSFIAAFAGRFSRFRQSRASRRCGGTGARARRPRPSITKRFRLRPRRFSLSVNLSSRTR